MSIVFFNHQMIPSKERQDRLEVIIPGLDTLVTVFRKYRNSDLQEPQFRYDKWTLC